MKITRRLTGLLLCLTLPWAAWAANENIRFESRAEVEVEQVNEDGTTVLVREPAKLVVPGTQVIYTNRFTNLGEEPADNIVITNPVPAKTEYLAGSATPDSAAIVFSVDGGTTYAAPSELMITEADGGKQPAEAKDYTHIRWTIQNPLPPGETGEVTFRARVK